MTQLLFTFISYLFKPAKVCVVSNNEKEENIVKFNPQINGNRLIPSKENRGVFVSSEVKTPKPVDVKPLQLIHGGQSSTQKNKKINFHKIEYRWLLQNKCYPYSGLR
ncbi:unnamed protein product [Schistosoma mattheei]|uniref:Uncharacterized protein n=1 Tax=Schistosoma mattheei TaxID=31246 RepID=A0A183PQ58_9TREM|nr:unnamed protein product [Schistosoma mattheei]